MEVPPNLQVFHVLVCHSKPFCHRYRRGDAGKAIYKEEKEATV